MKIEDLADKRSFPRKRVQIPIKYKFINHNISSGQDPEEEVYEGITTDLSEGGLLCSITFPKLSFVSDLLIQKMIIGVNILLEDGPVKALCRTCWIGNINDNCGTIGLEFRNINIEGKMRIRNSAVA
jgi:hypothetical protein